MTNQDISHLQQIFQNLYNKPAECLIRSPGRVNLIGEHIDYSGYGVLPMAIEQDVVILYAKNTDKTIRISNTNSSKFTPREFPSADGSIFIDSSKHDWVNYFLSGYKGVLEHAKLSQTVFFDALVSGIVPMGAGLSSSSAFVCASALTTATANNLTITTEELASICAHCERYVGLEGGGMDQAISLLAEKGKAKLIEFNPLKARDVQLPPNASFVIANSLVESTKYLTANTCYNMRVVECRLAAVLLAYYLNLPWKQVRRLKDVQDMSQMSLSQLASKVESHLHKEAYTLYEIAQLLDMDFETIKKDYLGKVPEATSFECYKRALHVYTESERVYQFDNVCNKSGCDSQLQDLGDLMNQSQASCSELFQCSCPELDKLTSICRKSGALGSRLTGAGWGGCTISLVPSDLVSKFIENLRKEYYQDFLKMSQKESSDPSIMFSTTPGQGAVVSQL